MLDCLRLWAHKIFDGSWGVGINEKKTPKLLPPHPKNPNYWAEAAENLAPDVEHIGAMHAICLVNELAIGLWNAVYPALLWCLNKIHWLLHVSSFQFLFQQLGMLVSFVRSHIRPYMDEIVTLMRVSTIFKPAFYCRKRWIVFLSLPNISIT